MVNKNLAQLSRILTAENLTIAVAESSTSGLIQHVFSREIILSKRIKGDKVKDLTEMQVIYAEKYRMY